MENKKISTAVVALCKRLIFKGWPRAGQQKIGGWLFCWV